jgi:hypothetical protein
VEESKYNSLIAFNINQSNSDSKKEKKNESNRKVYRRTNEKEIEIINKQ